VEYAVYLSQQKRSSLASISIATAIRVVPCNTNFLPTCRAILAQLSCPVSFCGCYLTSIFQTTMVPRVGQNCDQCLAESGKPFLNASMKLEL